MEAATSALTLLDNAANHICRDRSNKALKDLNKDLLPLAEDEEMFAEAAPLLFGESFEKKVKDHLESLKCLRKSMAPRTGADQFFRKSRPHYPSCGAAIFAEEAGRGTIPMGTQKAENTSRGGYSSSRKRSSQRDRVNSNSSNCIHAPAISSCTARTKNILSLYHCQSA